MIDLALAGTALGAALAASLHCAGMCGPLVALAGYHPGPDRRGRTARRLGVAAHGAGRLVVYVMLGAAAGRVGATIDDLAALSAAQGAAARVAGLVLVIVGVLGFVPSRTSRTVARPAGRPSRFAALRRGISRYAVRRIRSHPLGAGMLLGAVSGLLPCGLLWAFVLAAAAPATAAGGAVVMAAFWLGTVPALSLVGLLASAIPLRWRRRLAGAVPLVTLGTGVFVLAMRTGTPLPAAPEGAGAPASAPCHGSR